MYIERLTSWMNIYFPDLVDSFNPPASKETISSLESMVGVKLPPELCDLYLIANGQNNKACTGLWYGFPMLSISEIAHDWHNWNEIYLDDSMQEFIYSDEHTSYKNDFVKPMYCNPKWITLANDSSGNCIGLDYDPGPKGKTGQVISFGRDEFTKYVLADSFADFLKWFVGQLELGNYQITEFNKNEGRGKELNTKFPPTKHFLDAVPELFK